MEQQQQQQEERPRTAQINLVATHPEVYPPCDDSFALVDALLADLPNLLLHLPRSPLCLEIGSGSGYVLASLALLLLPSSLPNLLATDLNPHALLATSQTLTNHGIGIQSYDLIQTDMVNGLDRRLVNAVDLLVVNPPYVPTPEDEVGVEGIGSSWAGGMDGRRVIDRVMEVAGRVLSRNGLFYLVAVEENRPGEICGVMRRKGFGYRIVVQRATVEESLLVIKFWRLRPGEEGGEV